MKKTILYLGLNDQRTKKQKIKTKKAVKMINNLLLSNYSLSGATLQISEGIYKHESGKIVTEKTITIILLDIEDIKLNAIIKDLKDIFNQETVLKETSNIIYNFI